MFFMILCSNLQEVVDLTDEVEDVNVSYNVTAPENPEGGATAPQPKKRKPKKGNKVSLNDHSKNYLSVLLYYFLVGMFSQIFIYQSLNLHNR